MRASIVTTYTAQGVSVRSTVTRDTTSGIPVDVTLPAAKAGTLTTRTDDNTGVATLSTGHGIATSDVVDVYWTGGYRRGMTATVATNAVTIDGGAGSNLPSATTAVNVVKQVTTTLPVFDGDLVPLYFLYSLQRVALEIIDDTTASVGVIELANSEPYQWHDGQGVTNLLAGHDVKTIVASNGTTTETTLKGSFSYDLV